MLNSRASRPSTGLLEPWRSQPRVLAAVFKRDLDIQTGKSGIGFVLGTLEPLLHIGILCLWHYLVRIFPAYGTSVVLFVSTGIYPVFVFIHLSIDMRFCVRTGLGSRRFPVEQPLDFVLSGAFITLFGYIVVGIVLFAGIALWVTEQAIPYDIVPIVESMIALACMGFGVGVCSAIIGQSFPVWHYFWGAFARILIFFSGVLYVADFLPIYLREILVWNPVLHAVGLFRLGFYSNYPMLVFDPYYMWAWATAPIVIGLCLLRLLRRPLSST